MNLAPEKTLNDFKINLAKSSKVYLLSSLEYRLVMAEAVGRAREQPKVDISPFDPLRQRHID